jgi:hypothetical protein
MAMMYAAEATRIASARLLAWDAPHLYEAVRWSQELGPGVLVKIATSDSDFARFLQVLPELAGEVEVLDITARRPGGPAGGAQGGESPTH